MNTTYSQTRSSLAREPAGIVPLQTSGPTDAEIVVGSVRSPDQFTLLFERHWADLHRFCASRAGSAGEDVAAETFRVAFDGRRRYDPRFPSAKPWLFGIASNLLREHFRSAEREGEKQTRSAAMTGRPGQEGQLCGLERRLLGAELAAALQELPAADRDALLLRAWGDLDYEQIAWALDVPLGTVRSRIHRARQRVRGYLKTTDIPSGGN